MVNSPSFAPRIAFVVYNDVHGDTRVLKTALTLKSYGAEVRIFATSSETRRYPDGLDTSLDGLEIFRLPTLPLQRIARRMRGTPVPTQHSSALASASRATGSRGLSPRARVERVMAASYGVVMQWLFWRRIAKHISAWKPSVVHAHDANTLPAAVRAARKVRARLIYDSHELWTDRNVVRPRPFRDWLDKRIEAQGIAAADAVITVSPSIARFLRERYRLPETPVLVRNVPPFLGDVKPLGKLRALAQLDDHAMVIAYCGSITTNRGVESTIRALQHLDNNVHLVLLGEGERNYVSSLRVLSEDEGLSDRVHFVGRVPSADVPATLADADASIVFTVPICRSYLWSLPNKLFESIHAGVPIIASDLPDVAELVLRTGVGQTSPIDNERVLADTIKAVLDDSGSYRENARLTARTLNWQQESSRLTSAYRTLISWPTETTER